MAAVRTPNRWFGVGHSATSDPSIAGATATAHAIDGRDAAVLFLFTSLREGLRELVEAARSQVGPNTTIVGGTTFGEIAPSGPFTNGVVAMALGGDGLTVRTTLVRDAGQSVRDTGVRIAQELGHTGREHEVLILLPDGAIGGHHEIIRGAYSVLGATIPMIGGCTGDVAYLRTWQFHGNHSTVELLSGSVIGVLIGSDAPIGVGMAHGWHRYGEPMSLTNSSGTWIYEFDHRPALDTYLQRAGGDMSATESREATAALTLCHPLGLARRSGEDIRVIEILNAEDRSIKCFADVPQGALAWLMQTDQESLISSGWDSCRQAVDALGGAPPIGVMAFNCGVRKLLLQEHVEEEIAQMAEAAQNAPLGGFYSMGEIARIRGARGMHHLTSVVLAFA